MSIVDDGQDRLAAAAVDIPGLYATHRLPMIRLAVLLVDDIGTAEDVVQDAFIGLTRAAPRLRDTGSAVAYLRSRGVDGNPHPARRFRRAAPGPG